MAHLSAGDCFFAEYFIQFSFVLSPVSAIVDTLLLVYYVLDYGTVGTFVRSKKLPEPYWYRISFPYVLHPFKGLFIAGSIFMVVAISAERHRAICSPLTHRPAFWPYAVMVFCISSKPLISTVTVCDFLYIKLVIF